MPRYFFDLILGSTVRRDHVGSDLPDLDAARRMALVRLADAAQGSVPDLIALEVLDARSVLLARISIVARAHAESSIDPDPDDVDSDHAAWVEEATRDAAEQATRRSATARGRHATPRPETVGVFAQRGLGRPEPPHLPQFGIVKANDDDWSVVELQTGSTALYDLRELVGLSREDAEEFADRLNFREQSRSVLRGGRNVG